MTRSLSFLLTLLALLVAACGDDITKVSENDDAPSASATYSSLSATPPTGVVADGATSATITIVVRDHEDRPVPGVAVQLAATGLGNLLNQPSALTDVDGTTTGTLSSITPEEKTISASVDPGQQQVTLAETLTIRFVGVPGEVDDAASTVTVSPAGGVVADGLQTSTITVTVLDSGGNPVPGQTVQLASTGTDNLLVQPTGSTDASGVVTGTVASTTAENKTVFAVLNPGASQTILGMAPAVQFVADASNISAILSSVSATPGTGVVADGAQVSTVTVTVEDANGNPVAGQAVELACTGSNNTITQPAALTDASGVATGSIASTTAEEKTVTASVPSAAVVLLEQATVAFLGDAANISTALSSVTAVPTNVQADGTSAATITVTLKDVNDNSVFGQTVQLSATGGNNTLVQSPVPTDEDGLCTGTLASIVPELKAVTAIVNPGPGEIVLPQTPTPRFVGDLIEPDDVRLCYGEGLLDQPTIQTWDDSLAFWSAISSGATANATIQWTVGGFRPNGNFEYLLGVLSDRATDAALDLLRWDGDAWIADWSSTAMLASSADKRGFDLQHESSSGEALVVYSDNTSNPVYRTRSAGAWSSESNVFATPPHVAAVLWVELVAREGTDEIALVYADVDSRLHAVIWTGSAWDELGTETTLSATLSTVTESQAFDVAYESSSGDLLVLWGHQFTTEDVQYATKPADSNAWATVTLTNALAKAKVVRLAPEPGTDRIAAVLTEGVGDDDTVGMIWDGSDWMAQREIDYLSASDDRDAAIGWVGTTGRVLLVYKDLDGGSEIDYVTWSPFDGWGALVDFPVSGMGDIAAIQMESFREQDELMVVLTDTASNLFAATFDGAAWTLTNFGLPLASPVSSVDTQPFCFTIKSAQ